MKKISTIIALVLFSIGAKSQALQFIYANVSNASCGSTADGSVCWDVAFGFPPYYVDITGNIDSNSAGCKNGLSANTYTITVSDFSGGMTTTLVTVGINSPMVKIFASDTTLCFGDSITLSPMYKRDGVIGNNNYCNPIIASASDEEITNVTIGDLNNFSACGEVGMQGSIAYKYQNYTNIATTILASSTLPVSITIDECNGGVGTVNSTAIYIDYNIDGDFMDAGEQVFLSTSSTNGAHVETGNIYVPNYLQRGITRMRVITGSGSPSNMMECGSYTNGEVEDYTVFFEQAPVSLFWQTLGGTGIDTAYSISSAQSSTYTLAVDYGDGCIDTASLTVQVGALPVVTIAGNNVSCPNASIQCNVINSTSAFTYNWLPTTQNTQSISNLVTGTYTCFATDTLGCQSSATFNMVLVPAMVATPIITNVLCFGDSSGSINLNMSGGTVPYTYNWVPSLGNNSTINSLAPGVYQATVTDGNLCTYSINTTVSQPSSILTTLVSSNNCTGFGLSDGKGKVVAQGGSPSYSYLWAPSGETTDEIVNKPAGTYSITVTDANGCKSFATIVISQPNAIADLQKIYNLQIFPNPASNEITITSSIEINDISIANIVGQVVVSATNCQTKRKEINISNLSNGVYIIVINGVVANKLKVCGK